MRRVIDKELVDLANWPGISTEGMAEKAANVASRRVGAMKAYLAGASMADVFLQFRLSKSKVLELFRKCISPHDDGRLCGFRACIPHARCGERHKYKRVRKVNLRQRSSGGFAGLMTALFEKYPHILEDVLERALLNRNKNFAESGLRLDRLHARFIVLCRLAGIPQNEYPFCTATLGERSFKTHLKREMLRRSLRASVAAVHGDEAAKKLGFAGGSPRIGKTRLCYERIEVDGHRLDLHAIHEMLDPKGGESLLFPLERIWIIVAIEVSSRAVIGYWITLERHYTAEDFLSCLESCLVPWKPRKLTIPGLSYPENAGLPSGVIPELAYAKFGELAFDNDKSHLSRWVFERVQQEIGCVINPGPVKTPESRQFIERFFRSFESAGFQRLPSTTGSDPNDPRRRDPEAKAIRHRVRLNEIEELVDVIMATYNATPSTALHGRSPLEYLRFAVENNSFFIRTIPEEQRADFCLTTKTCVVKVRGYLKQGVRPFVELFGVRYYGERLGNALHLIGQNLQIMIRTKDLRTVRAFLPNGEEFDTLTAAREWAGQIHDLKTRQNIRRYARLKRLHAREMPDPVEAYIEFKKGEKGRSKKSNNEIVRVVRQAASLVPVVESKDVPGRRPSPPAKRVPKVYKLSRVHLTGVNY
jgi:hypothetical protein